MLLFENYQNTSILKIYISIIYVTINIFDVSKLIYNEQVIVVSCFYFF